MEEESNKSGVILVVACMHTSVLPMDGVWLESHGTGRLQGLTAADWRGLPTATVKVGYLV